ncbi:MAG: glycosyltransferase family 2 protein [Gammaproteobacteria bacterium]|nr:glycosyltransferase family 2 protein [Gammaproteobacteria bacterium]
MGLSIIVPAYNEEKFISACLEHIRADIQRCATDSVEVLVIDNASTDNTAKIAASFPGVRVVHEGRKGLTRARQAALESAQGEILAFVDADTRMPPGWIRRVLDFYASDPRLVCISGPYRYYDAPALNRMFVGLYWTLLAVPTYWITRYMAVGGNFAAKKTALMEIGGFDTDIEFYGEDTNIARRLSKAGKVRFSMRLHMPTSFRRLHAEGLWRTALKYVANFLSEVVLKRPVTRSYRDIR